uniref:Uncharacterized protein n=1 Tax=Arundo donax TaxID=35708 RepID=A0A0A9BI44_ARUDO
MPRTQSLKEKNHAKSMYQRSMEVIQQDAEDLFVHVVRLGMIIQ